MNSHGTAHSMFVLHKYMKLFCMTTFVNRWSYSDLVQSGTNGPLLIRGVPPFLAFLTTPGCGVVVMALASR